MAEPVGITEDGGADPGLARTEAGDELSGKRLERDRVKAMVRGSLFGHGDRPVRIGRFDILRKLGAGGMGIVYSAFDDELDRKVAIKLVRNDRGAAKTRLRREAQAIARLSHPNVAVVYEVGEHRGQLFIAMEFVRGVTLREWLDADTRTWPEIRDVFLQAGEGLAAAHHAGLVHRDFKPENAIVGEDGRVRVLDFGLAAVVGDVASAEAEAGSGSGSGSASERLTVTGALLGTPAYMAPEQLEGKAPDPRSDQFSFCVSLWQALYGKRPFAGDTLDALKEAVTGGPRPALPAAPGVPTRVGQAILRGLSIDPADRFPELDALLQQLRFDPASRRRRYAVAVAGLGLVAVATSTGYLIAAGADDACDDAATHLAPVWSDARREQAETALAGAEGDVSLSLWARSAAALDDFAGRWTEVYERTCRDTDASEDLRLQRRLCLQWQLGELTTVTNDLVEGKATAIADLDAIATLDGLPDPALCETEAQLRQIAQEHAAGAPERRTLLSNFDGNLDVVGGAGWMVSTDTMAGGRSASNLELVGEGRAGSAGALRIHGVVEGETDLKWAGAMLFPGPGPFTPTNLTMQDGVRFWVRGPETTGVVMLFTVRSGFRPTIAEFPVTPEWTEVRLPLDAFGTDLFDVTGIFVGGVENGPVDMTIDDFSFD